MYSISQHFYYYEYVFNYYGKFFYYSVFVMTMFFTATRYVLNYYVFYYHVFLGGGGKIEAKTPNLTKHYLIAGIYWCNSLVPKNNISEQGEKKNVF